MTMISGTGLTGPSILALSLRDFKNLPDDGSLETIANRVKYRRRHGGQDHLESRETKKYKWEDPPCVDSDDERDFGDIPFQDLMVDMEVLQEHAVELRKITMTQMTKNRAGEKISKKAIQEIYDKCGECRAELSDFHFKLDKMITDSYDFGYLVEHGFPRHKKGYFTFMPNESI